MVDLDTTTVCEQVARVHFLTASGPEVNMQAPTRSKQRGSYYLACLPEFAASTAFASQASVIQRSVSKSLRYERTLTLAWREATLRARPVLGKVIAELKRELPKRL